MKNIRPHFTKTSPMSLLKHSRLLAIKCIIFSLAFLIACCTLPMQTQAQTTINLPDCDDCPTNNTGGGSGSCRINGAKEFTMENYRLMSLSGIFISAEGKLMAYGRNFYGVGSLGTNVTATTAQDEDPNLLPADYYLRPAEMLNMAHYLPNETWKEVGVTGDANAATGVAITDSGKLYTWDGKNISTGLPLASTGRPNVATSDIDYMTPYEILAPNGLLWNHLVVMPGQDNGQANISDLVFACTVDGTWYSWGRGGIASHQLGHDATSSDVTAVEVRTPTLVDWNPLPANRRDAIAGTLNRKTWIGTDNKIYFAGSLADEAFGGGGSTLVLQGELALPAGITALGFSSSYEGLSGNFGNTKIVGNDGIVYHISGFGGAAGSLGTTATLQTAVPVNNPPVTFTKVITAPGFAVALGTDQRLYIMDNEDDFGLLANAHIFNNNIVDFWMDPSGNMTWKNTDGDIYVFRASRFGSIGNLSDHLNVNRPIEDNLEYLLGFQVKENNLSGINVFNGGGPYLAACGSSGTANGTDTCPTPEVASIDCASATLSPSNYPAAGSLTATLTVPYTGGNGADHGVGLSISSSGITGLTAQLISEDLATGAGSLTFLVTGMPSGPGTVNFLIPFGGQSCTVSVVITEDAAVSSGGNVCLIDEPNQTGWLDFAYNADINKQYGLLLKDNGFPYYMQHSPGGSAGGPSRVTDPNLNNIVSVDVGGNAYFALRNDGLIYSWIVPGLGVPQTYGPNSINATPSLYNLVLPSGIATIQYFDLNNYAHFGSPVTFTELRIVLIDTGGNAYWWGNTSTQWETIPFPAGVTGFTRCWALGSRLFLEANDGNYYASGYNEQGQLGIGNTTSTPINTLNKVLLPAGTIIKKFDSDGSNDQVSASLPATVAMATNGKAYLIGGEYKFAAGTSATLYIPIMNDPNPPPHAVPGFKIADTPHEIIPPPGNTSITDVDYVKYQLKVLGDDSHSNVIYSTHPTQAFGGAYYDSPYYPWYSSETDMTVQYNPSHCAYWGGANEPRLICTERIFFMISGDGVLYHWGGLAGSSDPILIFTSSRMNSANSPQVLAPAID